MQEFKSIRHLKANSFKWCVAIVFGLVGGLEASFSTQTISSISDYPYAIAVDSSDNIWVTHATVSGSSSLNATALPSGSSIAVSTGVTTLPAGWDFDGANLYQNGIKGASLPTGFANSNAFIVYTKITGGSTFGLGAIDTQDIITKTLQIDSGAVLKLGAGAVWARDITVHS